MSFSVDKGRGYSVDLFLICHLVLIRVGYTPLFDMSFSVDKGRLYTSFDMSFSVDKCRLYILFDVI